MTTPIVTSTAIRFPNDEDEVYYPRHFNLATQEVVADKIAQLENGQAGLVLSSGMAAIVSVLQGLLKQGDHAVFHTGVYGGTRAYVDRLDRYGIECTLVQTCEVEEFEQALRDDTRLVLFESPTNPLLQIIDVAAVAELARRRGVLTVVDNTFATPMNQNPLDLGVDVVVHSGTKYLNGHSDVNCGAVVTSEELMSPILDTAQSLGGTLDVRACYLLERGMKTLALRVERQCDNAQRLAQFLSEHPRVRAVHYPGLPGHPGHDVAARQMTRFGGMLSFELETDVSAAQAVVGRLQVATPAVSLGGVETLVCFPSETSHAKMSAQLRRETGISDTLVRVSAGIEAVEDLIADFEQALG